MKSGHEVGSPVSTVKKGCDPVCVASFFVCLFPYLLNRNNKICFLWPMRHKLKDFCKLKQKVQQTCEIIIVKPKHLHYYLHVYLLGFQGPHHVMLSFW